MHLRPLQPAMGWARRRHAPRLMLIALPALLANFDVRAAPQSEQVEHAAADQPHTIDSPARPDPANAATWYLQAAAKQRAVRHSNDQEFAVAAFDGDPSRGPTPEVQQVLRRYQPAIMLARRGARRESCNFATGISPTSPEYMQRIAQTRSLARILRLDYQQRIFNNDTQGAIDSIITLYRMAGHFAHEDTMLGSTVGTAMLELADQAIQTALDHAIIGPVEAPLLLREMDRFDAADPARFQSAARSEMAERVQPMLASFTGEGGVDRLREYWRAIDPQPAPETSAILHDLTQERLDEMLAALADATTRAIALLDEPDAGKALAGMQAMQQQIANGQLGPLADLVGYRLKAADFMQRARKTLADRRAIIAGIADGSIDPMSLANAAVWCIRATLQMDNIDPVKVQAIDAYAAGHVQPADAALTATFNRFDVQSVVESLRIAASINRCDFSYANWSSAVTCGSYHAGMLACGRLLVADAARLFHEQRYTECAERLAIAYRIGAHLATDGKVAGSLAAHRIFSDADVLAEAALDSRMLSEDHVAVLAEAVRTISRGDPFHYQPAIASMRQSFDYPMTYFVQGLPKDLHPASEAEQKQAQEILAGLSPDRLLSFAIVHAFWERDAYFHGRGDPAMAAAGLDSIYDMRAFANCADVAPFLTEWARTGQMDNITMVEFPLIAPLEERARQSIIDYRRCVMRMNRLLPAEGSIGVEQASESSMN